LERELRAAGFDVYVYENRFDDSMGGLMTRGPLDVSGGIGGIGGIYVQYGNIKYGNGSYGSYFGNFGKIVVNSIFNEEDLLFNVGSNLRSTFFIGGTPIGTFANVDATREIEFRELILKIKPVQTVAYLLVSYV